MGEMIPVVRIPVGVYHGGDPELVWWGGGDGKPRCARHRQQCLVKLRAAGIGDNDHDYVCTSCWRGAAVGEDIDVSTEAVQRKVRQIAATLEARSAHLAPAFKDSTDMAAAEALRLLLPKAADRDAARAALTDAIAERDAALAEVERLRRTPTPAREVASLALSFLDGFKGGDMPLVEGMAELKRWLRVCAEIGESAYGDVEDPDA